MPSYIPPHRRPSGAAALEKGSTPIPPNKGDKKLLQIADILEGNSLSIKANKEAIETLSKGALELGKLVRSHGRSAIIDSDFMATRIGDLERRIDRMQKGLKLAAAEVTTKNDDRHTEKSIKRLQQGLKLAATDAPTKKKSKRRRKRSKAKSRRRSKK
tara:strand:+ start:1056 stop:1529 length:474 start_codon:yes stop_codon:yes gene_type:complete